MPDERVDHQAIAHAVELMALDAVLGPGAELQSAEGAEILEILAVGSTILESARRCLHEGVAVARQRDCSWAEIGRALGMSRQAAFQRFGREG